MSVAGTVNIVVRSQTYASSVIFGKTSKLEKKKEIYEIRITKIKVR
jgi:hypothetical protein